MRRSPIPIVGTIYLIDAPKVCDSIGNSVNWRWSPPRFRKCSGLLISTGKRSFRRTCHEEVGNEGLETRIARAYESIYEWITFVARLLARTVPSSSVMVSSIERRGEGSARPYRIGDTLVLRYV